MPHLALRETCRGVTLVEAVIATLIVALLGAALGSAGETITATAREAERSARVSELGLGLLHEIAALPFDDPTSGGATFGPESGEWSGDSRAAFDDVDDYNVWTGGQALQQKDGTPIALAPYTRRVTIAYVTAGGAAVVSGASTHYKQITVTVYERGQAVESFVSVRVQGGRDVDFGG